MKTQPSRCELSTVNRHYVRSRWLNPPRKTSKVAGPSGVEPETAGFLRSFKSPVLYLAELRAPLTIATGPV